MLVSGTDGVGTKLKIAMLLDKHDTIGIDAVAMCVNDVVCCGARPLFFLDYIACGKNFPEKIAQIVAGVAEGCLQSECALVGGETAEHPGMMPDEDYDVAGFSVGIVDKEKIVDGSRLQLGKRRLSGSPPASTPTASPWCARSSASALMTRPTRPSWPRPMRSWRRLPGATRRPPPHLRQSPLVAMEAADVKAVSHITGGGFYENIPRMMKPGITAKVEKAKVPVLPIFQLIQKAGDIPERDMFNTFNMGIGLCVAVSKETAQSALDAFAAAGEEAVLLGEVVEGDEGVVLC